MSEKALFDENLVAQIGLATVIRTRLLGVPHEDQDVALDDDDWRAILEALEPKPAPDDEQLKWVLDWLASGMNCPLNASECASFGAVVAELAAYRAADPDRAAEGRGRHLEP